MISGAKYATELYYERVIIIRKVIKMKPAKGGSEIVLNTLLGKTEICEFYVALVIENNVRRLQIAIDDMGLMETL